MTNTERFTKLAKIGHESAQCAFGDDMPPASEVWQFLLDNAGCEIISDCGLYIWMQDSAPETMPEEFGHAYDAFKAGEILAEDSPRWTPETARQRIGGTFGS